MKIISSLGALAFLAGATCAIAQTAQLIVTRPPALAGSYAAVTYDQAIAGATEAAQATSPPDVITPPATNALPSSMPPIRRYTRRLAGEDPPYPRAAIRLGISEGRVVARLTIDEQGNVSEVIVVAADPPKVFDQTVIDTLKMWKFAADGTKYVTEVECKFKVNLK